jgi:hypothetical protein
MPENHMPSIPSEENPITCFISYARETQDHMNWVLNLADKLQRNGVITFIDQWDLDPGMDLANYMETRIRESTFVLLVCTPEYARKANAGTGGVGYEKRILTGEILQDMSPYPKFIPIIRSGNQTTALPSFLKSKVFIPFAINEDFEISFEKLLRTIFKTPEYSRPPLGPRPHLALSLLKSTKSDAQRPPEETRQPFGKRSSDEGRGYSIRNVFINFSFETTASKPLFNVVVFTVISYNLVPRTVLEVSDSSSVRLQRLMSIISECHLSIHNISSTSVAGDLHPRFNVPLELGLFVGAQRFDFGRGRDRYSLLLSDDAFQLRKLISDINGSDVASHSNDPQKALKIVSAWINNMSKAPSVIDHDVLWNRYKGFSSDLPKICRHLKLSVEELTFPDYYKLVIAWLHDGFRGSG